jgi:hypothetical protein
MSGPLAAFSANNARPHTGRTQLLEGTTSMRACLTALVALLVCAASGCANFNFLKRKGDCADAIPCAQPADSCTQPAPSCAQPIGCAAAVSPAGVSPAVAMPAAPAGVSPYDPGVAAAAPYYAPPVAYAPAGGYGGYGGFPRHVKHRPNPYGNEGGAAVGYPYYTTRGPRDFLLDNPPSIGR